MSRDIMFQKLLTKRSMFNTFAIKSLFSVKFIKYSALAAVKYLPIGRIFPKVLQIAKIGTFMNSDGNRRNLFILTSSREPKSTNRTFQ